MQGKPHSVQMARRARSVACALLLVHALACQVQISLAAAWDLVSADDGCPDAAVASVLFQRLNLSHPGLEAAKEAVASGDQTTACKAVAAYYSGAKTAAWLRHASPPAGTAWAGGAVDEVALNDTYDFYGEVGRVPRNADGGLNWYFRGPVHDDVRREPRMCSHLNPARRARDISFERRTFISSIRTVSNLQGVFACAAGAAGVHVCAEQTLRVGKFSGRVASHRQSCIRTGVRCACG